MELTLNATWDERCDYAILKAGRYDAIVARDTIYGGAEGLVLKDDRELVRKQLESLADAQRWAEQTIMTDNL